jgi:hypothetical protein
MSEHKKDVNTVVLNRTKSGWVVIVQEPQLDLIGFESLEEALQAIKLMCDKRPFFDGNR